MKRTFKCPNCFAELSSNAGRVFLGCAFFSLLIVLFLLAPLLSMIKQVSEFPGIEIFFRSILVPIVAAALLYICVIANVIMVLQNKNSKKS